MLSLKWFFGNRDDLTDVHKLHRAVFTEEQGVPEEEVFNGKDADCIHLAVYESGIPVACGSINVTDEHFILTRVCTLSSHRGQGLASGIVDTLIESCVQMGGTTQRVNSQVTAKGFYEKLGFIAVGDEYDIAGIPHVLMEHTGSGARKCGGGNCAACGKHR